MAIAVKKHKINIEVGEYKDAEISCACGGSFKSGSTKEKIRVEICSKCHPFFTGENKIIDTEGRVEKFKKRYKL